MIHLDTNKEVFLFQTVALIGFYLTRMEINSVNVTRVGPAAKAEGNGNNDVLMESGWEELNKELLLLYITKNVLAGNYNITFMLTEVGKWLKCKNLVILQY